jgi:hypothetical protein
VMVERAVPMRRGKPLALIPFVSHGPVSDDMGARKAAAR